MNRRIRFCVVLLFLLTACVFAAELSLDRGQDFAFGKFNGKAGIAVTFIDENQVVIYNGSTTESFVEWKRISVSSPWSIASGDFDGDGKDDLAVLDIRRTLSLLLSGKDYQPISLKNNNHRNLSSLQARKNTDGSWLFGTDSALWLYNYKEGLKAGYLYAPEGEAANHVMVMGDVDGDGNYDMIALSKRASIDSAVMLRVYYGPFSSVMLKPNTVNRFSSESLAFGANRIGVVDLNGDGKAEIIASDNERRSVVKIGKEAIELNDGGDVACGDGMFIFHNNRGARLYKGAKPVLKSKFDGRFRSCTIKDGFFYGLTATALEMHLLDASAASGMSKAEAAFGEMLTKNREGLAAADALAHRKKDIPSLKARDELLFKNNAAVVAAAKALLADSATSRSGRIAAWRALADIYAGNKFTSQRYSGHGVLMYPPQFFSRYCFNMPEEQVKEQNSEYHRALQELLKLTPNDMELRYEVGYVMLFEERYAEAREQFDAMLKAMNLSLRHKVLALFGVANCDYAQGKNDALEKRLEELAAMEVPNGMFRYSPTKIAKELLAVRHWDFDFLQLPVSTDGKPYPEPQQAQYGDWTSASKVALSLKGIERNDNRIRFLAHKLARLGIAVEEKAPFVITISQGSAEAPGKKEGYRLVVSKKSAAIDGKDKAGVFWGIISLLQMTDSQKKAFRIADITDYPDASERGFLFLWDNSVALELAMFAKMNRIVAQGSPLDTFMALPLTWLFTEEFNKLTDSFGMTFYTALRSYCMTPENISTITDGVLKYHAAMLKRIAKSNGGVFFPYDDERFPANWRDLEKYPIIGELDGQYVNKLYHEVKKECPNLKMVFCPPFYWGPDGPANNYGEKREDYLAAIGRNLDSNIDVYWTGPRVRGREKNPQQVKWMADLIKRKPFVFQNAAIYGAAGLHYYCGNPTPYWKSWHYDDFIKDIAGFDANTRIRCNGPQAQTAGDALWNWKTYDAEKSIRRAVGQLYGAGVYDVIKPGTDALNKVDRFRWQGWNVNDAVNSKATIVESIATAEDAWKRATAMNPRNFALVPTHYPEGVDGLKAFLRQLNDPNSTMFRKFVKEIPNVQAQATKEAAFDASKGDILRTPADFGGSGGLMVYGFRSEERLCTILRGRQTANQHLTFEFECDPFPPEGDYELWVSGQNHNRDDKFRIRVIINQEKVVESDVTFPTSGWSVQKFKIPFGMMKRNNTITLLSCTQGDSTSGPPWVLINYVVIKKATK